MEKKKRPSIDKLSPIHVNPDLLLTFLPMNTIDAILLDECFRLDLQKAPEDDTEIPSEENELAQIHRLTSNIKTQDSINHILQILQKTSYPIIKLKIYDFFMDFLLRPVEKLTRRVVSSQIPISNLKPSTHSLQQEKEKNDLENEFVLIMEHLPRAFQLFPDPSKNELLNTLARSLLILSPDKNQVRLSIVPSFQSYSATLSACTKIIELYGQPDIPKQSLVRFIHSIISYSISIAIKLATTVRFTHTNLSSYNGYIGEFLPLVATLKPVIDDNREDMTKLLCQFWIAFVIFSISNINSFLFQYDEAIEKIVTFLPPLISKPTKSDFSKIKYRIQEYIQLIEPPTLQRIDDIIPSFQKAIPNINVKLLYNLEFVDLVLAYSIYLMESVRANNGIFGPIFSYFEFEYYSNFTLVLDVIFDEVFNIFMKQLTRIKDRSKRAIQFRHTMALLIQNYTNSTLKIQSLVDQCFKQYSSSFTSLMFDKDVLQALSQSERPLRSMTSQRQLAFMDIIQNLFEKSTIIAPYSFLALLQNLVISSTHDNFVQMLPSFVIPVSKLLPVEYRETFITEFAVKAIAHGQAKFATKEHLLSITDQNDRLLVISAYIVQTSDTTLIPELITYAPQHSLLLAWSNVIMCSSDDISNSLVRQLFLTLIQMAKAGRGIFYNSDHYYKTPSSSTPTTTNNNNSNINNNNSNINNNSNSNINNSNSNPSSMANININVNNGNNNVDGDLTFSLNSPTNSNSTISLNKESDSVTFLNEPIQNNNINNNIDLSTNAFNDINSLTTNISNININTNNDVNTNSTVHINLNSIDNENPSNNNININSAKVSSSIRGSFRSSSGSMKLQNETEQSSNSNLSQNILNLPIDLEKEIIIQSAIIRFLIEQFSLSKYFQSQIETLITITDTPLYNHPSILPAIIPLAFLFSGCLSNSELMETKIFVKFVKFVFRLSFLAFSFKNHVEVFHYISAQELYYLEQLITILPAISKILKTYDNSNISPSNQDTINYASPSTFNSFQFPTETAIMPLLNQNMSNTNQNPTNFKILREISTYASIIRAKIYKINSVLQSNYASLFNMASILLGDLYSLAAIYRKEAIPQSLSRLVHLQKSYNFHFSTIIPLIFEIAPEAVSSIISHFHCPTSNGIGFLVNAIRSNLIDLAIIPELSYLGLSSISKDNKHNLPPNFLLYWKPLDFINSLRFLNPNELKDYPASTTFFVTRCFDKMDDNILIPFIPILIQSLHYDQTNQISSFILKRSRKSHLFAIYVLLHILSLELVKPSQLFQLEETSQSADYFETNLRSNSQNNIIESKGSSKSLFEKLQKLSPKIFQQFKKEEREQFHHEMNFFNEIYLISQRLYNLDPAERSNLFSDSITSLRIADDLFNPLNPSDHIASIDFEHSNCLLGVSQMPLLFCFSLSSFSVNYDEMDSNSQDFNFLKAKSHFETLETDSTDDDPNQNLMNEEEGDDEDEDSHHIIITQDYNELDDHEIFMTKNAACVFRSFFNIRNDALSMEILWILKNVWQKANLDVFVLPYRVFPTGTDRGITEFIGAKSRHEIGRATNENLLTYYIGKYGNVSSSEFKKAQDNFVKSLAPYSFFCYLIQAKDRHNKNILFDDEGHVIYINFGNILGSQEKMSLERAPFKLTHEMVMLLGGSQDNPVFQKFVKLFTQCFFVARLVHHEIETIITLMAEYGSFHTDPIKRLNQRFLLDKSPKDIVSTVEKLIEESYEAKSTIAFDALMAGQNKIFF